MNSRYNLRAHYVLTGACFFFAACGPTAVPPAASLPPSAPLPSWYAPAVDELTALDTQAKGLMQQKKSAEAAALIVKGEAMSQRLLAVPQPTLAATEAASDLDELYGRMLFSNRNYGWARLMFQKNLARWRYWKPKTPETAERLKAAEKEIADCDRNLSSG